MDLKRRTIWLCRQPFRQENGAVAQEPGSSKEGDGRQATPLNRHEEGAVAEGRSPGTNEGVVAFAFSVVSLAYTAFEYEVRGATWYFLVGVTLTVASVAVFVFRSSSRATWTRANRLVALASVVIAVVVAPPADLISTAVAPAGASTPSFISNGVLSNWKQIVSPPFVIPTGTARPSSGCLPTEVCKSPVTQ